MRTNRRVLVTGGAGFIGTALCRAWIEAGATVACYDDFSAGNTRILADRHERLTVIRGGVEEFAKLRTTITEFKPDLIYHLAALHYIPQCDADPLRALEVNVRATQGVLLCASEIPVEQVILASTSSVYADSTAPFAESDPLAPRDTYGLTKMFAEYLFRHFHASTGRTTTICRFFNVYGPGDTVPHIIPEILKQLARTGGVVRLGSLSPRRDFIALSDLVSALMAVTRLDRGSLETLNIGSGKDYTIAELVQMIEAAFGRRVSVEHEASRVRRFERPRLCGNIERIRRLLGWHPVVTLEEGLRLTVEAFPGLRTRESTTSPASH